MKGKQGQNEVCSKETGSHTDRVIVNMGKESLSGQWNIKPKVSERKSNSKEIKTDEEIEVIKDELKLLRETMEKLTEKIELINVKRKALVNIWC